MNKSALLAGLAAAWTIGAGVWLATNDCMYGETRTTRDSSGVTVTTESCSSLIEANGAGALVVLAFPVVFAIIGLLAVRAGSRRFAWTSVLLLAAFCLLGMATVGLFYLPALIALIVAVVLTPKPEATGRLPRETG